LILHSTYVHTFLQAYYDMQTEKGSITESIFVKHKARTHNVVQKSEFGLTSIFRFFWFFI